ncbi:MAG: hypothetical protein RL695_1635 [Pseudomonadota bacterium]
MKVDRPTHASPRLSKMALLGVVVAHLGLLMLLWQMRAPVNPVAPVVLSVSLLEPAQAVTPEPVPVAAPAVKSVPVKPAVTPPRIVSSTAPVEPATRVAVAPPVEQVVAPQASPVATTSSAAQVSAASASASAPAVIASPSPPRFDAAYLDNPKPVYPLISRRMKEEGRVLLRVQVAASGQAGEVDIHTSSGSTRLDQSALAAVSRWKFVPARQGSEAVAASVLVPIIFSLKE